MVEILQSDGMDETMLNKIVKILIFQSVWKTEACAAVSKCACRPYRCANSCLLADAVTCNVRITHLYAPGAQISQEPLSSNPNQAAYVTIACRCSFG